RGVRHVEAEGLRALRRIARVTARGHDTHSAPHEVEGDLPPDALARSSHHRGLHPPNIGPRLADRKGSRYPPKMRSLSPLPLALSITPCGAKTLAEPTPLDAGPTPSPPSPPPGSLPPPPPVGTGPGTPPPPPSSGPPPGSPGRAFAFQHAFLGDTTRA